MFMFDGSEMANEKEPDDPVAELAKSLQRTFPLMSWGRAIQVAEREIADKHAEISEDQQRETPTNRSSYA
jgi:hypothetical protein